MVAYLAMRWTGEPPLAVLAARSALAAPGAWRIGAEAPDLLLAVRGPVWPTVRALPCGRGWVVGDLHRRSGAPIGQEIDSVTISHRLAAEGVAQELCDRYWGRYVALIHAADGDRMSVFRDPSGAVDALVWTCGDLQVAASHLPDWLHASAVPDLAIDWDVVALWLAAPAEVAVRCGLRGVSSVTPGGFRPVGGGEQQIWRPAEVATRQVGTLEQATAALPRLLDACAEALTSPARGLLAEVSGGLDSAIVAASLAATSRDKVRQWINYYRPGGQGDERPYARAVADLHGVALTEAAKPDFVLSAEGLEAAATGLRPGLNALDGVRDRDVARRAADLDVDRVVTGQGGDMVFFQTPTAVVAADHMRRAGLGGLASPYLLEVSRWTRQSVWATAATAFGRRAAWPGEASVAGHPWMVGTRGLPPGKRAQIAVLAQKLILNIENLRARQAEIVHPLLAQPIVEHCLAIPTPDLTVGGRDRGLARRAFAGRIPPLIGERRGKGALTGYYGRVVADSLGFLRPYILGGRLAAEGLVDRERLEALLTREQLIWRGDYYAIVMTATVEAWVGCWEARARQAA